MKRPKPQQTLGLRLVAEKGLDAYDLTEEWQRPLILRLFWYRGTRDELFIGCAMRDDAGHAMGFYRLRWRLDS